MKTKEQLLPILKSFVITRNEMREEVKKTGAIPRHICESCHPDWARIFIDPLSSAENANVETILKQAELHKVVSITLKPLYQKYQVLSLAPIRVICPNPDAYWECGAREDVDVQLDGKSTLYSYSIRPNEKAFNTTFVKAVFDVFEGGVVCCDHIPSICYARGLGIIPLVLHKRIAENSLYSNYDDMEFLHEDVVSNRKTLSFMCSDCRNSLAKRSCPNTFEQFGNEYKNRYCIWERTLLLNILKQNYGNTVRYVGHHNNIAFLEPDKILGPVRYTITKEEIKAIEPRAVILIGPRFRIFDCLGVSADVAWVGDEEVVYYESERFVQDSLLNVIEALRENLLTYAFAEQGSDHDRIITALAKIGEKLGFVPKREHSAKGFRVDCIWIGKAGETYAAIEVETTGGIKKDIVTTWELEPNVAIIVANIGNYMILLNLTKYVLMKSMPHPLIVISTGQKMLYCFDKQEIVYTASLVKSEQDES